MNCPSCNQSASSFFRYAFSRQGVSLVKSIRGYLKCQSCGTLLHVASFGKVFWILLIPIVVLLALFVLLFPRFLRITGAAPVVATWIVLVLLIFFIFSFGLWKYAQVQRVDTGAQSNANTPVSS